MQLGGGTDIRDHFPRRSNENRRSSGTLYALQTSANPWSGLRKNLVDVTWHRVSARITFPIHTLTSTVFIFLSRFKSSMLSRYVLIASLMSSSASSSVSPCETHPWRVGQETTYPPASGSCSKTTGYSMCNLTDLG